MIAVTAEALEAPNPGVTPWVLLLVTDEQKRRSMKAAWEKAGFAVEIASDAQDALECLKVMTPSLIVIEDRLYRPKPH